MNTSDIDKTHIYTRKPESVQNGIPVFSREDAYIENYKKIASDHVSQISETQENPFMEEELWVSLEESTRVYIQKHVTKGSRILDVGVGLGRLLEPLTEYERYGVDISLDYLAIAKCRGIEVALAKIEDLPYQAGFFDAIVVCDVLEHVLDLNYCCEKILSCLRPGGVLIVRVPYKEDLSVYLNEDLPYEFIHLRNFDEGSLRLHFQKIFGLQFIEASPTTPYLQGTPRLKIRLLPTSTLNKLAPLVDDRPEFARVASAMQVSEEVFQAWIYDMKVNAKRLFEEIAGELIFGIEINAVFVKPYSEEETLKSLRAYSVEPAQITTDRGNQALINLGRDFLHLRSEVNQSAVKSEHLKDMIDHGNQAVLAMKQEVSAMKQEVSAMKQTLDALQMPLHKKIAINLVRFFGLQKRSRKT